MVRTHGNTTINGIITEVLRAANPGPLVRRALAERPIGTPGCRVLAVGKASAAMTEAAVGVLGDRVRGVLVVGPGEVGEGSDRDAAGGRAPSLARGALQGVGSLARGALGGVEVWGADHPVPSERNVLAAARAREFVAEASDAETLLVLLSGGASALLCLPRKGVGLADIARVTDALLRAGAPIEELNAVRKHCEVLKGGGLVAVSSAERVLTLVLSDVLGDRLEVIGSGPTAPDPTTFAEALAVLERRDLLDVSSAVTGLLRRGCAGDEPETIKPGNDVWERIESHVVGNNRLAVDAAVTACCRAGYQIVDPREGVEGEAAVVGRGLARIARRCAMDGVPAKAAIVWGGETTVRVGDATGLGGRNQELALAAAIELANAGLRSDGTAGVSGITILSFATDGRDGPADAAGAVIDEQTCARIRAAGIDPIDAIRGHDSHTALDAAAALIRTGPTSTNVNDVMVALIG